MAFENPPYKVVERDGHFEIRQYGDYIVAEVTVEGDFNEALSRGFRILADYIFGNNIRSEHIAMTVPVTEKRHSESEKIAMTAPVTSEPHGAGAYLVAFMMPSKYTLEGLPRPANERITFRTVGAHRAAAVRFSGSMDTREAAKRRAELLEWLAARGIETPVPILYANYSPPWIPPFLRRNEILADLS